MDDRDLHIDLDVHVHGAELEGRVTADGQSEHAFSGWIELLAALDALVDPSAGEA
jgi:hypothetical protein